MLIMCETKIDDSFANGQFKVKIFNTLFQRDRDKNGGSIIIFIRENISTNPLQVNESNESLYMVINLKRARWLSYSYHPHRSRIILCLQSLNTNLDLCSSKFENSLRRFQYNFEGTYIEIFCECFELKNFVKEPDCSKDPNNTSYAKILL